MAEHVYKPAEPVTVSGVYRVEHRDHRDAHEVTLLEGECFPACAICQDGVRFTLRHPAGKIRQDRDFGNGS